MCEKPQVMLEVYENVHLMGRCENVLGCMRMPGQEVRECLGDEGL